MCICGCGTRTVPDADFNRVGRRHWCLWTWKAEGRVPGHVSLQKQDTLGRVHPVYEKLQIRQWQLTTFPVPMLTGLEVPPRPRNLTSQQTASEPLKIRSVPETTAHRSLAQERRKAHRGRVHGGIHAPSCSALPP